MPARMPHHAQTTLMAAITWVAEHMDDDEGCICPGCNRYTQRYPRKITTSMAVGLGLLAFHQRRLDGQHPLPTDTAGWARTDGEGEVWLHKDRMYAALGVDSAIRGDVSKLKYGPHWLLLQEAISLQNLFDETNKRSGFVRVTPRGFDFVDGLLSVPELCLIYDDQPFWEAEPRLVSIHDVLVGGRHRFSYGELLHGRIHDLDVPPPNLTDAENNGLPEE